MFQPIYSTQPGRDLAEYVADVYDVGKVTGAILINRGVNDVYRVSTETATFALRLSNRRDRAIPNVEYETQLLAHLAHAGVPVAAAIPDRRGLRWHTVQTADGARPIALFDFLPGRAAERESVLDAEAQGATLAAMHRNAAAYQGAESNARLDLDLLVWHPLQQIRALPDVSEDARAYLEALAMKVSEAIAARLEHLTWVHCHGDCHGGNAVISDLGAVAREAAFFDFDDAAPGWLAYDIAVYLWRLTIAPTSTPMWGVFLRGYRSAATLSAADLDATPLFVVARHLWLLGRTAARLEEWGEDTVSPSWLDRQVRFLRELEASHFETMDLGRVR